MDEAAARWRQGGGVDGCAEGMSSSAPVPAQRLPLARCITNSFAHWCSSPPRQESSRTLWSMVPTMTAGGTVCEARPGPEEDSKGRSSTHLGRGPARRNALPYGPCGGRAKRGEAVGCKTRQAEREMAEAVGLETVLVCWWCSKKTKGQNRTKCREASVWWWWWLERSFVPTAW